MLVALRNGLFLPIGAMSSRLNADLVTPTGSPARGTDAITSPPLTSGFSRETYKVKVESPITQGASIKQLIRLALLVATLAILTKPAPVNKQVANQVADVATAQTSAKEQPHPTKKEAKEVQKPKAKSTPKQPERPVEAPQAPTQALPTDKTELMRLAGIPEQDYSHVDYIVSKESSWNYQAVNVSSGATGLCQALPASKMATEGSDYLTNPITQLKWCHKYANQRYGSWYSAFAFWSRNRWW